MWFSIYVRTQLIYFVCGLIIVTCWQFAYQNYFSNLPHTPLAKRSSIKLTVLMHE